MKTRLILPLVTLLASQAFADGFVCQSVNGDLNVKVFNHVSPELGTRNAAIMVLSNPSVQVGRKTIATFSDAKQTLGNESAHYVANVDLRVSGSARKGELIAGTKLGFIDSLALNVDFSYAQPVDAESVLSAELVLLKRNGEEVFVDLLCARYLKN